MKNDNHSKLGAVWKRLSRVRTLVFQAVSHAEGWQGHGGARVSASRFDGRVIRWDESGRWSTGLRVRNACEWRLQLDAACLALAHLRFGLDRPVPLVELIAQPDGTLTSVAPHRCGEDVYAATLCLTEAGLDLHWCITGPAKDARLHYIYRL